MIGNSRTPGRHRAGLAPTVVPHRLWDGPACAEAERLDDAWSGWTVLYGAGSRRFYAMATWATPEALIVSDHNSEGLEAQMRDAETAQGIHRRPYAPTPAGTGRP